MELPQERFDAVADLVRLRGFSLIRRSLPPSAPDNESQIANHRSPVYLLDSMGELPSLYREALLAFVGGSLVPVGGHNPIEAWAQGIGVVVGPYVHNFREIAAEGAKRGLLETVDDVEGLAAAFAWAIGDPQGARNRGAKAARAVCENRGAAVRTVDYVLPLLEAGPAPVAPAP
jgi:3-deoxy-D-manno-octulosonic-acid transferase